MTRHGTATLETEEFTDGQFATLAARVITALPKAIQFSGLDIGAILRHTAKGENLSLAVAEALKMLCNAHVATIPVLGFSDSRELPRLPGMGFRIEDHRPITGLLFNPSDIKLYVSDRQRPALGITGSDLYREELADKSVLGANYLDVLLRNKPRIPKEWKAYKRIFFWGTTYRDGGNDRYIRCLEDGPTGWGENHVWSGEKWLNSWAAAIL